jgi:hypothetical protein
MKWTIEFIENGNYFKVVNEGVYKAEDSLGILVELFSNKLWHPGASILFDNRLANFTNVNYQVMAASTRNFAVNNEQIGNSKIVSLVTSPIGVGISRQFQTLLSEKSSAVVKIFDDEEKAVAWLTERQAANE